MCVPVAEPRVESPSMSRRSFLFVSLLAALPLPAAASQCSALLSHKVENILGGKEDLCRHAGKVVLVVNTASQCGYTPQYKGLQAIHERYKSKGLVILGFPSNDFGSQEPGSNQEIADFCDRNYAIRFPLFAKTSVKAGASPLYDGLGQIAGERPRWNFHKYLIARDGRTVASFKSDVDPESPQMTARIEEYLRAK